MIILAWIISVLAALAIGSIVGFKYRELRDSILKLTNDIKEKADKKPDFIENKSSLLDPYDPVLKAQAEHEALMKKLNP